MTPGHLKKLSVVFCLLLLSACVQMPTEKSGVVDTRPQLSFRLSNEGLQAARVLVDGLDLGALGDYQEGIATVRVLPGTHRVQVVLGGQVRFDQKIYVGDGVQRNFLIP